MSPSNPENSTVRAIAACLIATMAVLAALSGTGYGPKLWCAGIAAWIAAILLWNALPNQQRRQAILLGGIGACAFGVAIVRGGNPAWISLLTQNIALLGMLATVSFLQLIAAPEEARSALPKGNLALWRTAIGAHLLGAVINLSTVFIMADRIGSNGRPSLEQVSVLARAYIAAALWSPFFAATGIALTYAPGASPIGLVTAGIPLAIVFVILSVRDIIQDTDSHTNEFVGYPMRGAALFLPSLLAFIVGIGHWLFPGWGMTSVISIAALSVVVITLLTRQGGGASVTTIARHVHQRLPNMAGELILFLAAGCFAIGLSALIDTGAIWIPFTEFGVLQAAIVLALMILLAGVGVHTVISISIVSTWLAPLHPTPTLLAMVFVQSWAIGLAASPASGTNLAIQGRYGISAVTLAKKNFKYCVQAYFAAVIWLLVAGALLGVPRY